MRVISLPVKGAEFGPGAQRQPHRSVPHAVFTGRANAVLRWKVPSGLLSIPNRPNSDIILQQVSLCVYTARSKIY